MIKYNWVCNQCSNVNQAGTNTCTACGCSAYARPDEIDARKDPKGYELKSLRKMLDSKIFAFCYVPAFIVVYAFNGNLWAFILAVLFMAILVVTDIEFVKYILKDKWAKKAVLGYSVSLLLLFLIKFTVTNEVVESTVGIFTLIYQCAMIYYLLKSQASKDFLSRYHNDHNA